MFWRVASGIANSDQEVLLSKDNVSLDDLLSAPYIVQEVNASNRDAIRLFTKEANLKALIDRVCVPTEEPLEGDANEQRNIACEIICSESVDISKAIVEQHSCLFTIFSAFTNQVSSQGGNSEVLRLASRIVGHLLGQNPAELLGFLKENSYLLEDLVSHAENLDVAETLTRLLGADDDGPTGLKLKHMKWIEQSSILEKLLHQMETGDGLRSEYAAEILAAIARARVCPLTSKLIQHIERILQHATRHAQTPKFIQALNICISLAERRRAWEFAARDRILSSEDATNPDFPEMPILSEDLDIEKATVRIVAPKAIKFMKQLAKEQEGKTQETPYGLISPPLGSARLTVMALIAVLLRTGLQDAEDILMESKLLEECLTLFAAYPFNSILHQQVAVIIAGILETGSDKIVQYLFADCNILNWLIELPFQIEVPPNTSTSSSRQVSSFQAGYTGHITHIANCLLHAGSQRSVADNFLVPHEGWQEFVLTRLKPANEREDVSSWACGRPKITQTIDSGESVGHDLLDDELAANMEFQGRTFGLGMRSAFSSGDSDEDDDEMTRADLLFEDAETVSPIFEEAENGQRSHSRFKITQTLPSSNVNDWEDLLPDSPPKSDRELTPRPDDSLSQIIKMSAPLSPFNSEERRRRSFDASEPSSNPINMSPHITITKEDANSEAGILNKFGSPPSSVGIGSLSQALSSSLSIEGKTPPNQGHEQNEETQAFSTNLKKKMSKTSDKDSKIIEKEDKDDLFNEINASLLDEELEGENDLDLGTNALQVSVSSSPNGSHQNEQSSETKNPALDPKDSPPRHWLDADKLRDARNSNSAILLP